jgi:hypothetical protein
MSRQITDTFVEYAAKNIRLNWPHGMNLEQAIVAAIDEWEKVWSDEKHKQLEKLIQESKDAA